MTTAQTNKAIYVVDTHALVWYLTADNKLSETARLAIKEATSEQAFLVIPAVVLAELFMIAEKQRTTLVIPTLQSIIQDWQASNHIILSDLTPQLIIKSAAYTSIPDIFDRLIVTEAEGLDARIITRDPVIAGIEQSRTIW
ncbi:MAG: hypothetical protein CL610_17770 [Anaerolineaceae bacterium]|nr:hypothetical protein [Anaerolineaceae bacterium]